MEMPQCSHSMWLLLSRPLTEYALDCETQPIGCERQWLVPAICEWLGRQCFLEIVEKMPSWGDFREGQRINVSYCRAPSVLPLTASMPLYIYLGPNDTLPRAISSLIWGLQPRYSTVQSPSMTFLPFPFTFPALPFKLDLFLTPYWALNWKWREPFLFECVAQR